MDGGFSLRNVQSMKMVIKEFPAMPTHNFKNYTNQTCFQNFQEDLYFVCGLEKIGYNIASDDYAINFCTHSSFDRKTFCIHKSSRYLNPMQLKNLLNYCHEYEEFLSGEK